MHLFVMLRSHYGHGRMSVVGRGNNQRVKIGLCQQFSTILLHDGLSGGVFQASQSILNSAIFHISDIGNLPIGQRGITFGQAGPATVHTHSCHNHFMTGRHFLEYGEIQDGKFTGHSARCFEKFTSFQIAFF